VAGGLVIIEITELEIVTNIIFLCIACSANTKHYFFYLFITFFFFGKIRGKRIKLQVAIPNVLDIKEKLQ